MIYRIVTAIVAIVCVSVAQAARAQERITLRYGEIANSARGISALPINVAQRMGFLAREGIDLKIVGLRGVQYQIEELDRGNVDFSYTASPYLIQAVLKGSDAVGVVGGAGNTIYSLIAKPEIKSFDDLKGKVIGLSLPVDTITIATRMLLEKHGLKEPAFRTKELIGTPIRAECLTKGDCDAVPLGQPDDIVLKQQGYSNLGNSLEVIPVLQFGVVAAERAWAAANRDKVVRFTRAMAETFRFMRDPAHREETARLAAELTGASIEVVRSVLTFYYEPDRGVMPKAAEISMPGLTEVIDLLGRSGELKAPLPAADRFVDLQYLKAAGVQ
jgi:ABC-type nitrate/sulfonate/bicarbonate transport system substrate-binding protein